jgi:predicted lipoprotein with Yx(FWY)xxD motif
MPGATARTVVAAAALLALAGCGTSAASPSSSGAGARSTTTVATATVSGHGKVLVAGSNSMTLYQFSQDTAGSGTSACTGSCIGTWPPLTISAGTTPSVGAGITGQVGTIMRTDGHGIQVTYNGRPLHFFSGDSMPGDANGNYPGWSVVAATSSAASASPSASPGSGSYPYGG